MIEALKHDDIILKFGGRFKLCALMQRRWLQLMQGARPLVDNKGLTELETVVREVVEGKLEMELPDRDEVEEEEQA